MKSRSLKNYFLRFEEIFSSGRQTPSPEDPRHQAFTLIEMLVVLSLVALAFGISLVTFQGGKTRLTSTTYDMVQDIQGLYGEAIRTGKVHRIQFLKDEHRYQIQVFEMPPPKPSEEDREAFEKWQEVEDKRQERLSEKPWQERSGLDYGDFKMIKEKSFSDDISIKTLVIGSKGNDEKKDSLMIYPSGEMEQSLIVLEEPGGRLMSLLVEPMSGRVQVRQGEVTEEEWEKGIK